MEPPPPVKVREDPWFAVRVAFGVTLAFALTDPLNVAMPMMPPVLIASLLATSRGAFNIKRTAGAGIAIPVICWLSSALVSLMRDEMLVFMAAMLILTFFVMLLVMHTANRMGLLLLVFPHLLGLLGVKSLDAMAAARDSFVIAGFLSLAIIPLGYLLFPPTTKEIWTETFEAPDFEKPWLEAVIRTAAMAPLMLAFYLWVDVSDMIYIVMALLVLVYPYPHQQKREAVGRIVSTLAGGAVALVVVVLFSLQPNFLIAMIGMFLGVIWFGARMMREPLSAYMHQLGMTVFVVLAAGAATGANPFVSVLDRLALTIGGVAFALGTMFLARQLLAGPRFEPVPFKS